MTKPFLLPGTFVTTGRFILASGSPRRKRFLKELGLTFDIVPALVDEEPSPAENPFDYVARLSRAKAIAVARRFPEAWVLGADTVVVLDGIIWGKPADDEEARRMLKQLSGRRHEVVTGYCICNQEKTVFIQDAVQTEVDFIDIADEVCNAYVRTGEPLDKAGGYAIQGRGGFLVESIRGSHSNVVGLPLAEVVRDLLRSGAIKPAGL